MNPHIILSMKKRLHLARVINFCICLRNQVKNCKYRISYYCCLSGELISAHWTKKHFGLTLWSERRIEAVHLI